MFQIKKEDTQKKLELRLPVFMYTCRCLYYMYMYLIWGVHHFD